MSEEKPVVVEAEVVDVPYDEPAYTEQDVLEAFQMAFNEILILKTALAEVVRQLEELKAKNA